MDNDLVSVIIPVYNTEKYIQETIISVLNQTHSNLELIVVDDGSTDNTAALVNFFCANDSRVKLIKQKNQGVSAARNTGFAASKGRYISYLDADDVWLNKNLELWIQKFNSDSTLAIVHSDCQEISIDSQLINTIHNGDEGYLLDDLLLGTKWVNSPSGILIKREVIESTGGFDAELSTYADKEFLFRAANKYKIGRVPKVTWYYRIHSNNMHYNIKRQEQDALLAFKKATQYKLFKSRAFRRKCYSSMYFMNAGSFWITEKNMLKTIKYLLFSFLYSPSNTIRLLKK